MFDTSHSLNSSEKHVDLNAFIEANLISYDTLLKVGHKEVSRFYTFIFGVLPEPKIVTQLKNFATKLRNKAKVNGEYRLSYEELLEYFDILRQSTATSNDFFLTPADYLIVALKHRSRYLMENAQNYYQKLIDANLLTEENKKELFVGPWGFDNEFKFIKAFRHANLPFHNGLNGNEHINYIEKLGSHDDNNCLSVLINAKSQTLLTKETLDFLCTLGEFQSTLTAKLLVLANDAGLQITIDLKNKIVSVLQNIIKSYKNANHAYLATNYTDYGQRDRTALALAERDTSFHFENKVFVHLKSLTKHGRLTQARFESILSALSIGVDEYNTQITNTLMNKITLLANHNFEISEENLSILEEIPYSLNNQFDDEVRYVLPYWIRLISLNLFTSEYKKKVIPFNRVSINAILKLFSKLESSELLDDQTALYILCRWNIFSCTEISQALARLPFNCLITTNAFIQIMRICDTAPDDETKKIRVAGVFNQIFREWNEAAQRGLQQLLGAAPEVRHHRALAEELNHSQSTHLKSVERSVSDSAKRLKDRYQKELKNDKRKAISDIVNYVKKQPENDLTQEDLHKLQAAKRCIERITASSFFYFDPAAELHIRDILILYWIAIHDEKLREGTLENAKSVFIEALYEIQRGNNIDVLNKDNMSAEDGKICERGTFNKIVDKLASIHPDVVIIVITKKTFHFNLQQVLENNAIAYALSLSSEDCQSDAYQKLLETSDQTFFDTIWPEIKNKVFNELSLFKEELYPDNEAAFINAITNHLNETFSFTDALQNHIVNVKKQDKYLLEREGREKEEAEKKRLKKENRNKLEANQSTFNKQYSDLSVDQIKYLDDLEKVWAESVKLSPDKNNLNDDEKITAIKAILKDYTKVDFIHRLVTLHCLRNHVPQVSVIVENQKQRTPDDWYKEITEINTGVVKINPKGSLHVLQYFLGVKLGKILGPTSEAKNQVDADRKKASIIAVKCTDSSSRLAVYK